MAGPRAVGYQRGLGTWAAGAVLSNPTDNTVIVDTGPISPGGEYIFACYAAGSVAAVYDVEHRDAANASTLQSQRSRPAAGNDYFIFPNKITILNNERVRCSLRGGITGELQISIFFQELN